MPNFETSFLKNEHLFKILERSFLVEGNWTEKATFPYITTLSKANGSLKWTYHKERSPVTNYLFNSKFNSCLKTSV